MRNCPRNVPTLRGKMNVMKGLEQLDLGRFSVSSWICGLENWIELNLLNCSDYTLLQKMPNLQLLILNNDSKCRELPKNFGEGGGFLKLVRLQVVS